MKNVEQTIISQYGNSATITKLICNMNEYIDPCADIDNFYNFVWNVETAIGFGLDIWGEIVGVSREIFTNPVTYLDDDAFRSLILLKALSNISIDSAPSINQLLQNWLGVGTRAYMLDLGQMMIMYVFEFLLTAVQLEIITGSTIFLRGAGVGAFIETAEFPVIGFAEMGLPWVTTMGNGEFFEGVINAT
jgi:hypothetical protein